MSDEMMDQQLSIRVTPSMVARAERILEAMKKDPNFRLMGRLSISSAWRRIIEEGLLQIEAGDDLITASALLFQAANIARYSLPDGSPAKQQVRNLRSEAERLVSNHAVLRSRLVSSERD